MENINKKDRKLKDVTIKSYMLKLGIKKEGDFLKFKGYTVYEVPFSNDEDIVNDGIFNFLLGFNALFDIKEDNK